MFLPLAQWARNGKNYEIRGGLGQAILRGEETGLAKDRPAARRHNVTIRDVAAELQLSITTVSRALGGYPDVAAKTRERVEEMAARLGYRPNRNAQRLVTRRTNVLAWIVSDDDRVFVDPHFAEVLAGVLHGARTGKYDVTLTSDTPERQIPVYERYVRDNSVDGFFIDLPRPDDPRIDFLLEAGRPFVVHGREQRADRYAWVDIDNFGIFRTLTELMLDSGHERIAFINGDEHFAFAVARRHGVEAALDARHLPRETVRIYNTIHPMGEAGAVLTERALAEYAPTAVIYSSALVAVEGQAALARAGLTAGDTIAVASMDDCLHHLDLTPYAGRITFARSSLRQAGMTLAAELIHACEAGGAPRGVLVPTTFDVARGMEFRGHIDTKSTGAKQPAPGGAGQSWEV